MLFVQTVIIVRYFLCQLLYFCQCWFKINRHARVSVVKLLVQACRNRNNLVHNTFSIPPKNSKVLCCAWSINQLINQCTLSSTCICSIKKKYVKYKRIFKCIENCCCDEFYKVNKLIILCDQLIFQIILIKSLFDHIIPKEQANIYNLYFQQILK